MAHDYEVFRKIAQTKGVGISINKSRAIHLDMNMIEASLDSAIANSVDPDITLRLKHLKASGSDAQKVDFVMGKGKYYFPDDIEMLAKLSRQSNGAILEGRICEEVCHVTGYVLCRCLGNGEQECFDMWREICKIQCRNE